MITFMKKNLILFLIITFSSFLLLETLVRLFYPQGLKDYWTENEAQYGLMVNKKNYSYKNHRIKNLVASYNFGEFRNRITISKKNFENHAKILVLGDSYTFGWLLKDEFTFIHKLQLDNLNFQIINSSVAGWGSSSYTMFAELFCESIEPKKIIIFMNTADIYRSYNQNYYIFENGVLRKNKIHFQKKKEFTYYDKKIPLYRFLKKNSQSFILIRNTIYNIINPPPKFEKRRKYYYTNYAVKKGADEIYKITNLNREIFLRLKKISNKCGADLLVIYNGWVKSNNLPETNPNKKFLMEAKAFFGENNINFFNLSKSVLMSELYQNPNKFIFEEDLHPNENGANLIYNASKDKIKEFINF